MNFTWVWQIGVTAVIIVIGIIYIRGWRKLQRYRTVDQSAQFHHANNLALFGFFAGLLLLGVALVSPMHKFASQYFYIRVTQHLLLVAWIPSLILATNPFPVLVQGLPIGTRQRLTQPHSFHPLLQQSWHTITAPGSVLLIFAATFWLWYDPTLHQATLRYGWLRLIEVVTLLGAAGLYWWHITGALPRNHKPLPWVVRIIYTFIGVIAIKLVGLIVMFVENPYYVYPNTFYMSGIELDDQRLGGIVFWIIGGGVYATTALLLVRRWLGQEEVKPSLPESTWASEEAMLAPGLKK